MGTRPLPKVAVTRRNRSLGTGEEGLLAVEVGALISSLEPSATAGVSSAWSTKLELGHEDSESPGLFCKSDWFCSGLPSGTSSLICSSWLLSGNTFGGSSIAQEQACWLLLALPETLQGVPSKEELQRKTPSGEAPAGERVRPSLSSAGKVRWVVETEDRSSSFLQLSNSASLQATCEPTTWSKVGAGKVCCM